MLTERGVDAVRVEPLAKLLNVTKGSFYWHFADREELHRAVLDEWRRRQTSAIIGRLGAADAKGRLRQLLSLPRRDARSIEGASLEFAIRQWARSDSAADAVVREVDALRIAHMASAYEELGFSAEDARAQSFLLYSVLMGQAMIEVEDIERLRARCEALLIEDRRVRRRVRK